jgi:hypothetical protein
MRYARCGDAPIDHGIDVDGFQRREQLSPLFVQRGDERIASQRAGIVIVLTRPIDLSRRQRGIVDAAHTDEMPQLFAKRREAVANPMGRCRAARRSGRIRGEVPLVVGDRAHKIDG